MGRNQTEIDLSCWRIHTAAPPMHATNKRTLRAASRGEAGVSPGGAPGIPRTKAASEMGPSRARSILFRAKKLGTLKANHHLADRHQHEYCSLDLPICSLTKCATAAAREPIPDCPHP